MELTVKTIDAKSTDLGPEQTEFSPTPNLGQGEINSRTYVLELASVLRL